jgi:uncharacterized protein (UPF0335 family)
MVERLVGSLDNIRESLRAVIERIERLEADKAEIAADIAEVKKKAKSDGFDIKVINTLIRERRKDADEVEEFNIVLDTYRRALETL